MIISLNSQKTLQDIFNQYTDIETQGFTKTVIPVNLIKYEGMELMSRSQARRLITRFDKFQEVILDFKGIELIGQGFADELFRVFTQNNPDINLVPVNTNENIKKMIRHVLDKERALKM